MYIVVNFKGKNIFEKKVRVFGTGAHIIISKQYAGEKVKIVTGKNKIIGNKIELSFFGSEILERKACKFGTGAHVLIPKEHMNKKVKIIVGGENG